MSWLSKVNPTPSFPAYTGPHPVGTVDIEVPVTDIEGCAPAPDEAVTTVSFRIFYPCEPGDNVRPVRWIPTPQRAYVAAYARFLGANTAFASILSAFPHLLYYATIPVHRNAALRSAPTSRNKWPVMMFSHGLGGSRNAYSHICGSVASHGIIVIAPDHRDRSTPISFIRTTEDIRKATTLTYNRVSHDATPEVYAARDGQLRIRLWELTNIHEVLLRMEDGKPIRNLNSNSLSVRKQDFNDVISMFRNQLDVYEPGRIIWAGHSFGACTSVQLLKSVHYNNSFPQNDLESKSLLTQAPSPSLIEQITPFSPIMLLDMWCLPLRSPSTEWLWKRPLPCFSSSGTGGTAVLSISSETFFDWKGNLNDTKRALSPNPMSDSPRQSGLPSARLFYIDPSAHHNQSDFGILFPWLTKKFFKVEEPERIVRLNVRAMLEVLRENEFEVADTSWEDMEEEKPEQEVQEKPRHDKKILDQRLRIKGWIPIRLDEGRSRDGSVVTDKKRVPADEVVEGEAMGGLGGGMVGEGRV